MNTASEILAKFILVKLRARGVRIEAQPHGGVRLIPAHRIDRGLRDQIDQHKAELLVQIRAEHNRATDEARALLQRLKTFTLPAGRMPVARELAERLAPFARATDPAAILGALRDFERELIGLGGAPDPELADAVGLETTAFPDARLVHVRKLQ